MADAVPFVDFTGSNYEIGRQLGEYSKAAVAGFLRAEHVVEERRKLLAEPHVLSASLKAAADRYPRYMEEMSGIAEGTGQPLHEIFMFNWRPRPRKTAEGCTTLVVPKADGVLLAHNEDWYTGTNDVFVARLHYESGLEFLGVCYHGFLPGLSASINQAGLVQALNSLVSSDGGAGVPLTFINRAALDAATIDEAIAVTTQTGRADSENFNLAQGTRAVYVETAARDFEVVEVKRPTVHTNHFLADRLKPLEASTRLESSLSRHARASRLLAALADPGPDDLRAILSCHEDAPWTICRHGREPGSRDYGDTLGTIIVDTRERSLTACIGPPCRSEFRRFTL